MPSTQQQQSAPNGMEIPKRWPLVTQPDNRAGDFLKDARLINCYAERDAEEGGYQVEKRYGLAVSPFVFSGVGRGIYNWTQSTKVVWTQGLTGPVANLVTNPVVIIINGTNINIVSLVGTEQVITQPFPTATLKPGGICIFDQVQNATGGIVVFSDGTQPLYYLTPNIVGGYILNQVSDPNYPTSTVPGVVVLDGTTYVMTPGGVIYGSQNLNDPTVWNPLNTIIANAYADGAVYLARQLNYVVALKQFSTQIFYDAGNPPPESPLAEVEGAIINYGCASAQTVQEIDGLLCWVTSNKTDSSQVLILNQLAVEIVSTPAIERQLDLASPFAQFISWSVKHGGHRLYGITNVTTNVSLVYDIDQKLWYQWTDYLGNYYPIMAQGVDLLGNRLFQHIMNGNSYWMDIDFVYPNDVGNVFPVDIYTPNFDAGVDRIKYLSQMRFNADQQAGSKLLVRFSEDDYKTWNNFRSVSLAKKRPILSDCGSFYRRAYHFRHSANTSFRIDSIDLQMDIGTL